MKILIIISTLLSVYISSPAMADNAEDLCRPKWGNDLRMVEYCINKQLSAEDAVNSWYGENGDFDLLDRCEKKWTNEDLAIDYTMVRYCINEQIKAAKRLRNMGY